MARYANSFIRRNPRYLIKATVLVICEDSKSAKDYLVDAKQHFDVDATVDVAHLGNTDPLGIVKKAIARRSEFQRIYCVIDRDTHENFDEAVTLAASYENIELVVSYPCFEYWLLLHFQDNRKAYTRSGNKSPGDQMLKALQSVKGMEHYNKGATSNIFGELESRLAVARGRARRSLSDAMQVAEMNPSTRIHELFDAFEVMSNSRK